jgi:hypothetical protein
MTNRIPRRRPAGLLALVLVSLTGAGARGDEGRWVGTWAAAPTSGAAIRAESPLHFASDEADVPRSGFECFDPPSAGHVLARNRTWSPTFAKSCARPSHSEDNSWDRTTDEPPTRESNPALRLRRPPCVRHTRGETRSRVPLPGVEPGPRPSEGRVPSVTRQGRDRIEAGGRARTGMNLLTRQGPHRSATPAGAGAQGFEPCPRVLEARCSPRSTPLSFD